MEKLTLSLTEEDIIVAALANGFEMPFCDYNCDDKTYYYHGHLDVEGRHFKLCASQKEGQNLTFSGVVGWCGSDYNNGLPEEGGSYYSFKCSNELYNTIGTIKGVIEYDSYEDGIIFQTSHVEDPLGEYEDLSPKKEKILKPIS